jgi:hypothetical protein
MRGWWGVGGGLREVKELPEGVKFGYELDTFVVDVTTYLP